MATPLTFLALSVAPQWYGVAGYADWSLNKYLTPNLRLEYYGDSKGFTFGTGRLENVYEATLNVAIKPLPDDNIGSNLVVRPETRYDYSTRPFSKAARATTVHVRRETRSSRSNLQTTHNVSLSSRPATLVAGRLFHSRRSFVSAPPAATIPGELQPGDRK